MTAFRSRGKSEEMGTAGLRKGRRERKGERQRKDKKGETNNDASVTGEALGS